MATTLRIVSGVGLLLGLIGGAATRSEANVIYTVNRSVPSFYGMLTVTGSLVTDGTQGVLSLASFIDWNLTVESSLGMDELTGPASGQNSYLSIGGDSLTATPDGLFFDFSGAGVLRFMNAFVAGPDSSYWCLDNVLQLCSASSAETIVSKGTFEGFTPRTGVQMVAEVAGNPVPEPATVGLFGLGLAGLGAVRRRKSAA